MTEPVLQQEATNQALVALTSEVLPVWARHLASSRSQSEVAVADMLGAFAEIGPHLNLAARQSQQISAALAQVDGGITQLAQACDAVLQPVLPDCPPHTAAAITQVLRMIHQCVDALQAIAQPFEHETHMVSQQVERMYRGFQYQDRISQMLTVLQEDMLRLQHTLHAPTSDLNPVEWLQRLQSTYVMAEQHEQHHGSGDSVLSDDDETTFF